MSTKTVNCPNCGAVIPEIEGYVTWCDKCNWNIDPDVYYLKRRNLLDSLYGKIGKASRENLFSSLMKENGPVHGITIYTLIAYLISAMVYILAISMIVFPLVSFYRLFTVSGAPHEYLIALIVLLIGLDILPKFPRVKEIVTLERYDYPALYDLADRISEQMLGKRIDTFYANYDFNASFQKSGVRQKNCITIGAPYFSILNLDEKIAVLAHEIAHCNQNDTGRHWFVYLVIHALSKWYDQMIYFGHLIITLPLTWPLSILIKLLIFLLGIFLWRDSQKAEYYADCQAAEIAGVEAVVSTSRKFYFHPVFYKTIKQVANLTNINNLFSVFRSRIETVPEREISRVRTIERHETAKVHSSHPPTYLRNRYITEKGNHSKPIKLNEEEIERLSREFTTMEEAVQKRLLSDYREYNVFDYYSSLDV